MAEKDKTVNDDKINLETDEDISIDETEVNRKNDVDESTMDSDNGDSEKTALAELDEKLKLSEEQSKEYYDRLLRVSAEFENYKKRMNREMDGIRKYANETILKDILPVIDNLERAIETASESDFKDSSILQGVDLTLKELLKVFEKNGVDSISPTGESFDPEYHEAVMQDESDTYDENTVMNVLQKGYALKGRLLRPAMVIVSKGIKKDTETC